MKNTAASLLFISAIVFSAGVPEAQRRGGAPPGAGGPGRGGRGGASTIERITVHGKALEGNLEGDSPDRAVAVYLPPSYAADQNRRFPTVYLLLGSGASESAVAGFVQQSGDRLAGAQGFSEFIVVIPNASTLHGGSMYSNSVTTGDWERYIAEDLVGYIDSHYRTLAQRMSRGIAGHSMGGYGALRIGMKHPQVFANLYAMSACCAGPLDNVPATQLTNDEATAMAAAWSPNPKAPPLFLDAPVRDGKVRPEIIAKWNANALAEMLPQHASNLNLYYAIALDVGTADGLLDQNRQLHQAMTKLRIPHTFEEYDGDHANRIPERIERNVLPFFARHLAAPANLTAPSPPADRLSTSGR
jgi:S-formylglutathione hydrolase FrmB